MGHPDWKKDSFAGEHDNVFLVCKEVGLTKSTERREPADEKQKFLRSGVEDYSRLSDRYSDCDDSQIKRNATNWMRKCRKMHPIGCRQTEKKSIE